LLRKFAWKTYSRCRFEDRSREIRTPWGPASRKNAKKGNAKNVTRDSEASFAKEATGVENREAI